ncbi:MAG: ATP-binding cassette domain-containing protein, partial [Rhizobiaceae bacterium]
MTAAPVPVVEFKNVDIIFGNRASEALSMLDSGKTRSEILEATGSVLGAAGANLVVNEGEISVLMGLSGSGKSTLLRAVNGLNKVTRGEVVVH